MDDIKLLEELELLRKENNELKNRTGLIFHYIPEEITKNIDGKTYIPVLEHKGQNYQIGQQGKNLLIEGENIHSLHLLKDTHKDLIDLIYIDPPYNTGNKGFTYNDHNNQWLSFMYNRLILAKELLSKDGVIFISIDENEQHRLRMLCDQIFGEKNFLADLVIPRYTSQNIAKYFSTRHENMIVYCKDRKELNKYTCCFKEEKKGAKDVLDIIEKNKHNKSPEEVLLLVKDFYKKNDHLKGIKSYNLINDNYEIYQSVSLNNPRNTESKKYHIYHPHTNKPCKIPERGWRIFEEEFLQEKDNNNIIFGKNENILPRRKKYLKDALLETPKSIVDFQYKDGALELRSLFGKDVFDFPKSSELIAYILNFVLYNKKDATVLDFFAGSGTTGHAIWSLNKKDGGHRKFILCTNNENNICEKITFQRLKLCNEKYNFNGSLEYLKINYKETS